jgi:hypothetical protein
VEDYYQGIVQALPLLGPLIEAHPQKLESSPDLLQVSCSQLPASPDAFNLPFHSFYPRPPPVSPYFEQKPLSLPLRIWAPSSSFYLYQTSPLKLPFVLLQTPPEHDVAVTLLSKFNVV